MAESSFWEKSCESCLEEPKHVKARTLCFECHQFLCDECSSWHLRFKKSKGHHLIDLVSFTKKPYSSTTNEVQLSSDLLETLTISDSTVLYSTQVAVEKKDVKTIQLPKDIQIEPSRLKVTKCLEFSIESLEDKERLNVRGLASLKDAVVVAVYRLDSTKFLRVYDRQGNFLSSTQVSQEIWGMTPVDNDTFATCGSENKVFIWNIDHTQGLSKLDDGKTFNVDSYISQGIHFNGTYYCVLEVDFNTILVLDRYGKQAKKIVLKEAFGKKIAFGWDIHMDKETNTIFVPCEGDDSGLLSISIQGQPLWFCQLDFPWGITEIDGILLVADGVKRCFHLLLRTGYVVGKIPAEGEICGQPQNICYDQDGTLYQSFHEVDNNRDKIFVYSVTFD